MTLRLDRSFAAWIFTAAVLLPARPARAQVAPSNMVEALQERLEAGTVELAYDADGLGYLRALLDAFGIPISSQVLVFSASSMQFDYITQETPRALYYQDDTAVGAVQGGPFIEIITSDRERGVAFYTLETSESESPRFAQRTGECLRCHRSATRWAPGWIVASYSTGPRGELLYLDPYRLFTSTDGRTPFEARYGGWYVTGTTGAMAHRGNVTSDPANPFMVPPGGLNVTDLSDRIDTALYLEPGSDVVSLLTLEHQAGFLNLITRINAQVGSVGRELARGLLVTEADVDESIEELVAYATFANDVPLPSPVTGTSSFAETFSAAGPNDPQGRSLRHFDLETRVFRYPLSYMVYSQAFDHLDPRVRPRVLRRLYDVLRGEDAAGPLAGVASRGGAAAINILVATKAGLPDYWRPVSEGEAQRNR